MIPLHSRAGFFIAKNFKKLFILRGFYCIIKSEVCKATKKGPWLWKKIKSN